ncbi:MAG: V-type proton ATPase subunit E [Oscillospiraceae bacterium]|jgi:vacuolar-type H+-ATPase subunit E/Vma4|nr:V-type proton ATPase subunit E [Oscillospiraceae bacterium]
MASLEEKLDLFAKAITSDAEADSRAILEEVRRERETSLSSAENEALNEAYQYIKNKVASLHTENSRRVSRKMMECKRALYARREELAREILRDVTARVVEYTKTPAYAKQLKTLMTNAFSVFKGLPTTISLRAEDMSLVPSLIEAAKGQSVTFEQGHFQLGGLIAECRERQQQINQTFDANLDEWKTRFFVELNMPAGKIQSA